MKAYSTDEGWRARARKIALSTVLITVFMATVLLASHGPQRSLHIDVEHRAGAIMVVTFILRRISND